MDRFVSTFTNKIDAKGRVSIPASFRAVLERDGYADGAAGGIYCYPSLDAPALDAGGERLAKKIDGLLAGLPDYSDERDELSVALYGDVQVLSHRSATAASSFLRRFAPTPASDAHVTFVGLGDKFQMWEPEPLRGAAASSAREKVQQTSQAFRRGEPFVQRGWRRWRSTGMTARREPPGQGVPRADRAPRSRAASAGPRRRSRPKDGETYIDGTFGAGGYTRRHPRSGADARVLAHRSRSDRHSRPAALNDRRYQDRLTLVEGALRRTRPDRRRARASRRPTASCSTSASPRCSSTIPSAASRSRRDGPLDMRMSAVGADRRRRRQRRRRKAHLADILYHLGEERSARGIARAIVAAAR